MCPEKIQTLPTRKALFYTYTSNKITSTLPGTSNAAPPEPSGARHFCQEPEPAFLSLNFYSRLIKLLRPMTKQNCSPIVIF